MAAAGLSDLPLVELGDSGLYAFTDERALFGPVWKISISRDPSVSLIVVLRAPGNAGRRHVLAQKASHLFHHLVVRIGLLPLGIGILLLSPRRGGQLGWLVLENRWFR